MGIAFGLLGNLGLPSFDSRSLDKLYANYFEKVTKEEEFLCAFINLCSDFNAIMPGKHCTINQDEVKSFYINDWLTASKEEKKKKLIDFMVTKIEDKSTSLAMMSIGCAAPFGAIALKKSGERVPQLKKFRIDLVPNFVIVPTITLISVVGVRLIGLRKGLEQKKK